VTLGYLVGLIALAFIADSRPDDRDIILGLGPIPLTLLLFVGQYLLTRHEATETRAGRPTGAHANRLWAWMLLLYIVVALLDAGINSALSGRGY
jgi:hypothetical protein